MTTREAMLFVIVAELGGCGRAGTTTTTSLAVHRGHTYYIRASGNDSADGTSIQTAWRSLARVDKQHFVAGDRILLEGGITHAGSIILDRGRSDGQIAIGSHGPGRATIDAGAGPGIQVENLDGVTITGLNVHGAGEGVSKANGILIRSSGDKDAPAPRLYANITIEDVEVSGFQEHGIYLYGGPGSGLKDVRIVRAVVHDNALSGITMHSDPFPERPHQNVYIGDCLAYHNHGKPGLKVHTGTGIVIGGVRGGVIEYSESYGNGDRSDATETGGPVGLWAWNSDHVTIQFNRSHDNASANNADGGGYDLDGNTTNSVMQYNVSWGNYGYGYQLWDLYMGEFRNNVVHHNVTIGDATVTSSHKPTPGQGALVTFGNVIDAEFHHNIVVVPNADPAEPKLFELDHWGGTNLRVHDNLFIAGPNIRPFDVIEPKGTGLVMDHNHYVLASEPRSFRWGNAMYDNLAAWQAATGLDQHSTVVVRLLAEVKLAPSTSPHATGEAAKIFDPLMHARLSPALFERAYDELSRLAATR
jgi:hypothetical protein